MIARHAPFSLPALPALLALPTLAVAQGPPLALPEASQAATASQRIGLTDITEWTVILNKESTAWGSF